MESYDDSKKSESLDDVIYRRLKNRERQRRYRERKRLQADAINACATNPQSDPSELPIVPVSMNGAVKQIVTRVHCPRDWKKDARRVRSAKQEADSTAVTSNGLPSAVENRMMHSPSGTQEAVQNLKNKISSANSAQVDNSDKLRFKAGKRAWKAEARNKK